jgi:hypothetical protein
MKILSLSLTLAQLKELCEKKMTILSLQKGSTLLRIKVEIPDEG